MLICWDTRNLVCARAHVDERRIRIQKYDRLYNWNV